MKAIVFLFLIILSVSLNFSKIEAQVTEFNPDTIKLLIHQVNDHFLANIWKNNDRNWIRGTYYTGLMACWEITRDSTFFEQARNWGSKHGWRTGTEWIYPANRMTCVQTYLKLYKIENNEFMIKKGREVMDSKIDFKEPAEEQGWDYVDALYVGIPAYYLMQNVTGDQKYGDYANKIFWDVYSDLFDETEHLFYRDKKAKDEKSSNEKKVIWSRGNGWAIAAIPGILEALPDSSKQRKDYIDLLQKMAFSLKKCQGSDGFWRTNLTDSLDYPNPESSGTAFFTYALVWGINKGYLDGNEFFPVVEKGWKALYHAIDSNGKVCWGQGVARGPGIVSKSDSHEYVSGAFLLAASEILKMEQED